MKLRSRTKSLTRFLPGFTGGQGVTSFIFIVLSLCLFFFSAFQSRDLVGLRAAATDALAPALSIVNAPFNKLASHIHTVSGLANLQAENARLRQENEKLRKWYQMALTLESENRALQDLLNISLPPENDFVTARVVTDSGSAYVKTLLVKAGKHNGVRRGQAVLASHGVVGRIVSAGNNTSRVLLLNDINSRIPVYIEGQDIRAILAGDNGPNPVLKHVPEDTTLENGGRVITSGHGSMFPYGLPVGTVVKSQNGRWLVKPFVPLDKVSFVRIVENNAGLSP